MKLRSRQRNQGHIRKRLQANATASAKLSINCSIFKNIFLEKVVLFEKRNLFEIKIKFSNTHPRV